MKKRTLWLCLVPILLVSLVVVALLEPNRIVRGFFAGEAFFRGRPTSYWREVLRKHGRAGNIPRETAVQFMDGPPAFPVLRACASDPDPLVRWPAIGLLGESGIRSQEALELLAEALHDEHIEVRLKALSTLARWGPKARPAVPALVERLKDPELQVAHLADLVLWEVDEAAAIKATGWRPFSSARHHFSVMVQAKPEQDEKPLPGGLPGVLRSFATWHMTGPEKSPTRYTVAVSDYPAEVIAGTTEEERVNSSRDAALFGLGGKLVSDKAISQHGLKGREQTIEVEGRGVCRNRVFWVGNTLYQVNSSYVPRYVNAKAADYFLDSFRLITQGKNEK